MIGEIDVVTQSLQTRRQTLAPFHRDLDILIEYVQDYSTSSGTDLYQFPLGTKYIASDAYIVREQPFISVVVKIQSSESHNSTSDERSTVSDKRTGTTCSSQSSHVGSVRAQKSFMQESLSKRKRKDCWTRQYYNYSYFVKIDKKVWLLLIMFLPLNREANLAGRN